MNVGELRPLDGDRYAFRLRTLTLAVDGEGEPPANPGPRSPALLLTRDGGEIGQCWLMDGGARRPQGYFNVKLDCPALPGPLYLFAWPRRDGSGAYDLVFRRDKQPPNGGLAT